MARGKFASPTLKLRITKDLWDDAVQASSGGCLLVEAIKRQYPHLTGISVDMATVRVSDPKKGLRFTYLTPENGQTLLLSYDQGWAQPDEQDVTLLRAVKVTKMQRHGARAQERAARLAELEEKEAAGVELTREEKTALTKLRKNPERATSDGPSEASSTGVVHGRAPKQGPAHPNLLRGRRRVYGAKSARPAQVFEDAVEKAVEERLAEKSA